MPGFHVWYTLSSPEQVQSPNSVQLASGVKIRNSRATAFVLFTALSLTISATQAQNRPLVSLTYHPMNVVGLSASVPMFNTQDVTHSARAGVSYAFTGLPAVNATYILSGAKSGRTYSYVGAGVGLAFPEAPVVSPSFSGHALAGVSVEVATAFSAFGEVVVAGNGFGSRISFGIGVSYAFGGTE